jgi:dihydrofolate reductase
LSFRSFALPEFWKSYESLPEKIQRIADRKFALFEQNPFHPSLALKQKGEVWTAVGRSHRAIAYRDGNDFHWFWIGSHETYNSLLHRVK